jgi:cell division septal protein FtsQ
MFESPPSLKQEQELVLNLNSNISKKNLSKFLNNQNWIDAFLIKRHVFKPLEIFIKTKEPKYIWKDKFYLDSSLSKFIYSGEHPHLVHLDMPIEFVDQWSQVEDQFHSIVQLYNLKIFSVSYTESEGWYFNTETNLRINLGADLSTSMLEKLSLTLKYIFEKNLTPSIIDLRYKDGAALNYGK